jgi:hypothetical protein
VEAVHERPIAEVDTAAAARFVGTEGGVVSAVTVTVTLADAEPAVFVAVKVYVVVVLGDTEAEVSPDTFPGPLLIDKLGVGLPETDQDNTLDWPATMVAGDAEKTEITGAWAGVPAVVAEAGADCAETFPAAS